MEETQLKEEIESGRRNFGPRIAQMLQLHNWTKKELSEKSGVSTRIITNIINNPDYKGSLEKVMLIANAFGLNMRDMYVNDKEWEMVVKFHFVPEYFKKLLDIMTEMDKETFERFVAYGEKLIKEKKKREESKG